MNISTNHAPRIRPCSKNTNRAPKARTMLQEHDHASRTRSCFKSTNHDFIHNENVMSHQDVTPHQNIHSPRARALTRAIP